MTYDSIKKDAKPLTSPSAWVELYFQMVYASVSHAKQVDGVLET